MRVFKKPNQRIYVLLCVSLLFNILLLGVVAVTERQGHTLAMALERRDIVHLDDESHPDFWARAGWTNLIEKLHTDFDIAFFGNSITCCSDFQQFFPDLKIINLGYPGDNITGMLRRVPMLQAASPSKVFIMAGTNDIFHLNITEFERRYNKMLDLITESIPTAKIYLQSIIPMNQDMRSDAPSDSKIQEANKTIEKIARRRGLVFIDIYSLYAENGKLPPCITRDGVHLCTQHYDRWAKKIEPFVME